MSYATVLDRHPDLSAAMARRATACCLNFGPDCRDEWLVREWRRQFEHAAQSLSTGFSGLPEPLDFFYTVNTAPQFPAGVIRDEPVIVFQFDTGLPAIAYGDDVSPTFAHELTTFILGAATIFKSLHDAGFVLRQLPLNSVVWNRAARRYSFREGLGIAPIGHSNFHPRIGFPMIMPQWSAPECFDAEAEITPASDVYALGKTVLALLGHNIPRTAVLPNVHDAVEGLERRFGNHVPDRIRRLLLLALHPDPHQRTRDMDQVVGMLFDGDAPVTPPTPPLFPQASHIATKTRPRAPQKPLRRGPSAGPRGAKGGGHDRKGPHGGA